MKFFVKCTIFIGILACSYFAFVKVDTSRSSELSDKVEFLTKQNEQLQHAIAKYSKQKHSLHSTLSFAFPDRAEQIAETLGIVLAEPVEDEEIATSQATQPVVTRPAGRE